MSLVVLSDGQKFEIEPPVGMRNGVLRQRERKILTLTFKTGLESEIYKIKKAFSLPEKTETITLYFPDEKELATEEQLAPTDGTLPPAHEVFSGFTILGERREEPVVETQATENGEAVYKTRFTLEIGQRQFGEYEEKREN